MSVPAALLQPQPWPALKLAGPNAVDGPRQLPPAADEGEGDGGRRSSNDLAVITEDVLLIMTDAEGGKGVVSDLVCPTGLHLVEIAAGRGGGGREPMPMTWLPPPRPPAPEPGVRNSSIGGLAAGEGMQLFHMVLATGVVCSVVVLLTVALRITLPGTGAGAGAGTSQRGPAAGLGPAGAAQQQAGQKRGENADEDSAFSTSSTSSSSSSSSPAAAPPTNRPGQAGATANGGPKRRPSSAAAAGRRKGSKAAASAAAAAAVTAASLASLAGKRLPIIDEDQQLPDSEVGR